jgi:hypothetical protein
MVASNAIAHPRPAEKVSQLRLFGHNPVSTLPAFIGRQFFIKTGMSGVSAKYAGRFSPPTALLLYFSSSGSVCCS